MQWHDEYSKLLRAVNGCAALILSFFCVECRCYAEVQRCGKTELSIFSIRWNGHNTDFNKYPWHKLKNSVCNNFQYAEFIKLLMWPYGQKKIWLVFVTYLNLTSHLRASTHNIYIYIAIIMQDSGASYNIFGRYTAYIHMYIFEN